MSLVLAGEHQAAVRILHNAWGEWDVKRRTAALRELAIAMLLSDLGVLCEGDFRNLVEAVHIADAFAMDLQIRGHEGGRDIADISPDLVDLISAWRSHEEDLEEDDPPEIVEPDEDDEPIAPWMVRIGRPRKLSRA